jgi:hypothetical protein
MWIPVMHNSSTKPLARLKHSLWALANPGVARRNLEWNAKYRLHKWNNKLPHIERKPMSGIPAIRT